MKDVQALLELVERTTGRKMETPKDFDWLAVNVQRRTRQSVSPSTLKRLWGYIDGGTPRKATLDALAAFAGYADFDAFTTRSERVQSNIIMNRHVRAEELSVGQRVRLAWQPERVCVVEYLGARCFKVVEARQTKLSVGDTFSCQFFIEREPLFIDQLCHEGGAPTAYVAGCDGGILFEVLTTD